MSLRNYLLISGGFFAVTAVLNLTKAAMDWDLAINGSKLPIWISWVGILVFGYLAYYALSGKKK